MVSFGNRTGVSQAKSAAALTAVAVAADLEQTKGAFIPGIGGRLYRSFGRGRLSDGFYKMNRGIIRGGCSLGRLFRGFAVIYSTS